MEREESCEEGCDIPEHVNCSGCDEHGQIDLCERGFCEGCCDDECYSCSHCNHHVDSVCSENLCDDCCSDHVECESCNMHVSNTEVCSSDWCYECCDNEHYSCEGCDNHGRLDMCGDCNHCMGCCDCEDGSEDKCVVCEGVPFECIESAAKKAITIPITEVKLSQGNVPEVTFDVIAEMIAANYKRILPTDFDRAYTVKKGVYSGTFAKRVRSWLHKECGVKITAEDLAKIGQLASAANHVATYHMDLTQALTWDKYAFGQKDGSCYWADRIYHRAWLTHNKAWGVRLYRTNDYNQMAGKARCWAIPTMVGSTPSILIFNAYGETLLTFARVLSEFTGMTYRKLENEGSDLYVNSEFYAVSVEEPKATAYRLKYKHHERATGLPPILVRSTGRKHPW